MKKVFLMALAVMLCGTVGDAKVNGTDDNDKTPDGVEAVDLGLSVKWANMNVGAKKSTGYGKGRQPVSDQILDDRQKDTAGAG